MFENRGAEVGATIAHPHGQIYAYDHVPAARQRLLDAGWRPDAEPGRPAGEADVGGWRAWVPARARPPDLADRRTDASGARPRRRSTTPVATDSRRCSSTCCAGSTGSSTSPLPYMMWINQRPTDGLARWPDAWFNIEIVSPWRSAGVPRFIAAAELGGEEYLQSRSTPSELAARLRGLA